MKGRIYWRDLRRRSNAGRLLERRRAPGEDLILATEAQPKGSPPMPDREKPPRSVAATRGADGLMRCPWPGGDPLYLAYHDEEWGVPEYDDRAMFEKLVLDGFQAGLSWITILRKRPAFRKAFDGFDPKKIARWSEKKKDALMQDAGIVRNRAKIEATVALARITLDLADKGGLARHLWSFVDGRPIQNARRSMAEMQAETDSLARHRQGPARAGRQFRRADDHLRLHAGDRHGQRPSRRLLPSRSLPGAGARAQAVSEGAPRRAWQRMLSGRRLDLIDPSPLDVEIGDIAHGLARVARWNGQTRGPEIFSVAQHSLLVEALFAAGEPSPSAKARLMALLHDAPEYVIGDMISPFKAAIGGDYKLIEERLKRAIHVRFGLAAEPPDDLARSIKVADRASAYLEATALAGFSIAEARKLFGAPDLPLRDFAAGLEPMRPAAVEARFLARFAELDAAAAGTL